VISGQP